MSVLSSITQAGPKTIMNWAASTKTFIIAEAGVNHNGSKALAFQMIEAAAKMGADAIKFQLFDPFQLTTRSTPLAQYQQAQAGDDAVASQQELLSALALPPQDFIELQQACLAAGIQFLCTPFDEPSARYLQQELQVPLIKVSSGELTNLPFLRLLGAMNIPLILSTGMGNLAEVQEAVDAVMSSGYSLPLGILHCVSAYPTPAEAVNLRAMQTLKAAFPQCAIGYSDHTLGIHIPIAAVALGACMIEKHFTLDKTLPGPDHQASITVEEFESMVHAIREIELSLGDGIKQPHPVEQDCIAVARKSIVVQQNLPAGHLLTEADLTTKRPGTGISPRQWNDVLGRTTLRPVAADELLSWEALQPK